QSDAPPLDPFGDPGAIDVTAKSHVPCTQAPSHVTLGSSQCTPPPPPPPPPPAPELATEVVTASDPRSPLAAHPAARPPQATNANEAKQPSRNMHESEAALVFASIKLSLRNRASGHPSRGSVSSTGPTASCASP